MILGNVNVDISISNRSLVFTCVHLCSVISCNFNSRVAMTAKNCLVSVPIIEDG